MAGVVHRIARFRVSASVADLDVALALRPRIERLAQQAMPRIIDRLCDALVPHDAHLQLARLELELGTVDPANLEEEALDALQRALTEALQDALRDARTAPSADCRLIDSNAALLRDFDTYLGSGRLPAARQDRAFDATARLLWLVAAVPAELTALLARRARDRHVLERLVLQTGDSGFDALLALLAPRDAAVIRALLADVILVQHDPVTPGPAVLRGPALERVLRVATLEFLLRDPGSQFNRRRFLAHLLQREARAIGVDYAELLRLLSEAVAALRTHLGLGASLPRILDALLAEPRGTSPPAAVAPLDLDAALEAARAGRFAALAEWVRRQGSDPVALRALVDRLSTALFAGLVGQLDPVHAALILALVDDLILVHRADPVLAIDRVDSALWELTLAYLARDPGTQFNRRRFLAFLIARQAKRMRIGYGALVRLFADALARLRARQDPRASLPGVLGDLLGELDADAGHDPGNGPLQPMERAGDSAALIGALEAQLSDPDALLALVRRLPSGRVAALLRRLRPASAATMLALIARLDALHRSAPLVLASAGEFTAWVRAAGLGWLVAMPQRRFNQQRWLDHILAEVARRGAVRPEALHRRWAGADPGADRVAAIIALSHDAASVPIAAAALREVAEDPAALVRLADASDPAARARLLDRIDPRDGGRMRAILDQIARQRGVIARIGGDAATFERLLWVLAIRWRAGAGRGAFDADGFTAAIVAGVADYAGVSAGELAAAVARASAPIADPAGVAIDAFLRGASPVEAGHSLVALAAHDPVALADAIRRQARIAPAHISAMTERLLRWLTPDELIDCLVPGMGDKARHWGEAMGGIGVAQWRTAIASILNGSAPAFVAQPGRAAQRLDRIALLETWLAHGAAPWWVSDPQDLRDALAALPEAAFGELDALFGPDVDGFGRLQRVIDAVDDPVRERLFDRLVPWAVRAGGAVSERLAHLSPDDRRRALARAAADALAGREPDLAGLSDPAAGSSSPAPDPTGIGAAIAAVPVDSARLLAWLDGAVATAAEQVALVRHFALLADRDDRALRAWLTERRRDARAPARWAALLPPEALARLVRLLVPGQAQLWLDAAAMVTAAARRTARFGTPAPDRLHVWTSLLRMVTPNAASATTPDLGLFIDRIVGGDADRADRLRKDALRLAQDGGYCAVAAVLRRVTLPPGRPRSEAATTLALPAASPPAQKDATMPIDEPGEALFIGNAGLILFAPYLPSLFDRLGLLTDTADGPRMVDAEAMARGVHLLQYLVDERCDRPEPELVLNKLLCGLPTAQPVAASVALADADRQMCDSLVDAIIANWTILGNCSRPALRETFLQREGRLVHAGPGWTLTVQRRAVDVLVDRIPWSIATVFHRWMPAPVQVAW
jgi:hypothetical protein